MANDGAVCSCAEDRPRYEVESARACNTRLDHWSFNGMHLGLVADRHIREGEEIFWTYGAVFWIDKIERGVLHADGTSSSSS